MRVRFRRGVAASQRLPPYFPVAQTGAHGGQCLHPISKRENLDLHQLHRGVRRAEEVDAGFQAGYWQGVKALHQVTPHHPVLRFHQGGFIGNVKSQIRKRRADPLTQALLALLTAAVNPDRDSFGRRRPQAVGDQRRQGRQPYQSQ